MEILRFIALIIILAGVVFIYSARNIIKKYCENIDLNENLKVNLIKICGTLFCFIGLYILTIVKF